jgi:hypothetical protein
MIFAFIVVAVANRLQVPAEVSAQRIPKENGESRIKVEAKKNGVHCHLDSSGSGGGRKSRD